jgi:hypothetical protein
VKSYGKMAVATAEASAVTGLGRVYENVAFFGLLGALGAYTVTTLDGGDVAQRIISSLMLFVSALYLAFPIRHRLTINIPVGCLLLMACYGAAQTVWSSQKNCV